MQQASLDEAAVQDKVVIVLGMKRDENFEVPRESELRNKWQHISVAQVGIHLHVPRRVVTVNSYERHILSDASRDSYGAVTYAKTLPCIDFPNGNVSLPMADGGQAQWEEFYLGSRAFKHLTNAEEMPFGQVGFLLGLAIALILSYVFRVHLISLRGSATTRHWGSFLACLGISYLSYGRQVLLTPLLVIDYYLLLLFAPATIAHSVMLVFALTFLYVMLIEQQFYENGGFVSDVTGPLMIIVQKATVLSYSLHDGLTKKEDLSQLQQDKVDSTYTQIENFALRPKLTQLLLRKTPYPLEFLAYTMKFYILNADPFLMFTDYEDFIQGTHCARRSLSIKGSLDDNCLMPLMTIRLK